MVTKRVTEADSYLNPRVQVKTRVVRRTLDPVYDEDFTFYGVHFNQLPVRSAVRQERGQSLIR